MSDSLRIGRPGDDLPEGHRPGDPGVTRYTFGWKGQAAQKAQEAAEDARWTAATNARLARDHAYVSSKLLSKLPHLTDKELQALRDGEALSPRMQAVVRRERARDASKALDRLDRIDGEQLEAISSDYGTRRQPSPKAPRVPRQASRKARPRQVEHYETRNGRYVHDTQASKAKRDVAVDER